MPDFAFTFTVHGISQARATAIQQALTTKLADVGAAATQVSVGQTTETYRVRGWDTSANQPFDQLVEASDQDAAVSLVVGSNPAMKVVVVGRGMR